MLGKLAPWLRPGCHDPGPRRGLTSLAMRERSALAALLGLALLFCASARLPLLWLLTGGALLALLAGRRGRGSEVQPDAGYLPYVSVVIPARDEEGVIAVAVEAALGQQYKAGFEVLVVDDGSCDGTPR